MSDSLEISQRPQPIDVEKRIIEALREAQPSFETEAVDRRIEAESIAIELYKCLGGNLKFPLLTPIISQKLRCERLLWGLSDQQLTLVNEAFEARYEESLASAISRSACGTWRRRLLALSSGDRSASVAHAIYSALKLFLITRRSDRFLETLESKLWDLEDTKRASVISSFNSLYSEKLGGCDLPRVLTTWLDGVEQLQALALVNGDRVGAHLYAIQRALNVPRRSAISALVERLRQESGAELSELARRYHSLTGGKLHLDLRARFGSDVLCDLAIALLESDLDKVSAARLKAGFEGYDGYWPGQLFLGVSAREREQVIAAYKQNYGSFNAALKRCSRRDRELLTDLIERGHVSWGKLFYLCVAGLGTDEDGLHSLLEGTSIERLRRAREEYRVIWAERAPWYERIFPTLFGDLERRIWIETGGDSWFDLREHILGASGETENLRGRLERLYNHERSGKWLKRLIFFSREDRVMDQDVSRIREFLQHFIFKDHTDSIVKQRFAILLRYAELDCATFRSLKHLIGNLVTAVVAASAATMAAIELTVMKTPLTQVMFSVAVISILTRVMVKRMLKGNGYHRDEILGDTFFGVLDGCTLFSAQLFRQAFIRMGTNFITKLGFRSGVSRLSRLVDQAQTTRYGLSVRALAES